MLLVIRNFPRLGHVNSAYCATALATATVAETKETKYAAAAAAAAVTAVDLAIGLVRISRFSLEQLLLLWLRPL